MILFFMTSKFVCEYSHIHLWGKNHTAGKWLMGTLILYLLNVKIFTILQQPLYHLTKASDCLSNTLQLSFIFKQLSSLSFYSIFCLFLNCIIYQFSLFSLTIILFILIFCLFNCNIYSLSFFSFFSFVYRNTGFYIKKLYFYSTVFFLNLKPFANDFKIIFESVVCNDFK